MKIEILGPGCARCETLVANTKAAVQELGLECEITKVTDIGEIVLVGAIEAGKGS